MAATTGPKKKGGRLAFLTAIVLLLVVISAMQRQSISNIDASEQNEPTKTTTTTVSSTTAAAAEDKKSWTEAEFVSYIEAHPNRNYFTQFFIKGGLRRGMEIGVADGRFSELFLRHNVGLTDQWSWTMVDPSPTDLFMERIGVTNGTGSWEKEGYLKHVQLKFEKASSLDPSLLESLPDDYYDFIYLDGLHKHEHVQEEMPLYWKKVRKGGILAGHDYCNYGEEGLGCNGCKSIPQCTAYTEYRSGYRGGKKGRAANQNGVVMAVQEWLVEHNDNRLTVHHTLETFTRESLQNDGFDYDRVLSHDRNPSWFIYKP